MANFKKLAYNLDKFANTMGFEAAKSLGLARLEEVYKVAERHRKTGRLMRSGFLYIDGKLVKRTGHDTGTVRVIRPDDPPVPIILGSDQHYIQIIYHTPKKASEKAIWKYPWRGELWFDYAPKVLGESIAVQGFVTGVASRSKKKAIEDGLRYAWQKAM